ncbi:MAG: hypothetical protein ACK5MG_06560 [Bacteroidales bacterium]
MGKICKIYLILLISLWLSLSTKGNTNSDTSDFEIFRDTIFINIKGEMTHALKHKDKLYVLFKQKTLHNYGGNAKRCLYIFSDGQLDTSINCPRRAETAYLDLYEKNDSIILQPYMDKQSYYLDIENKQWNKLDETDDLIFDDDTFSVYSLDFGEWGGKTWFKEKKNGHEYILDAKTPLINKIDKSYFLTSSNNIIEIENPRLLHRCDSSISYRNIEPSGKYTSWHSKQIGFTSVYQDTTIYDFFDRNRARIASSFVWDKELLHIYETDSAIYLAKHTKHSVVPIKKIIDSIHFYNWHFSYRCRNINGKNELLKFSTDSEQVSGLLEVVENKINIHYLINKALLKPAQTGRGKADSIFACRLNSMLENHKSLKLHYIDSIEQVYNNFDITPNHKMGISKSLNPNNYTIDTCKSYLVKEDSVISNTVVYYATKETGLIAAISIEWSSEDDFFELDTNKNADIFKDKMKFIVNSITNATDTKPKIREKENLIELIWKTKNGITIHLINMKDYNNIELIMFKN